MKSQIHTYLPSQTTSAAKLSVYDESELMYLTHSGSTYVRLHFQTVDITALHTKIEEFERPRGLRDQSTAPYFKRRL